MSCQKHKDLLERWWNDRLTGTERAELEMQLNECEDCRRELEGSRELWDLMGYISVPEPSGEMQVQFNAMLENYKTTEGGRKRVPGAAGTAAGAGGMAAGMVAGMAALRQLFAIRPWVAMGFSMVLLLGGFGLGLLSNRQKTVVVREPAGAVARVGSRPADTMTVIRVPAKQEVAGAVTTEGTTGTTVRAAGGETEGATVRERAVGGMAVKERPFPESRQLEALTAQVHEMREIMMISLLQNPSASERLRAVSYTSEIRKVNPDIAAALLATLNNDPNVNVRLTTLEALTHFARDPVVREGLIQSILQQDSPLVQAALADAMLKLQEKRAIQPFKKLLQQKDLNGMVRVKIEQTITRLT